MSSLPTLTECMRTDWNQRAREDARYFVAFGRRQQDEEEFAATASPVLGRISSELARLSAETPQARRRFLEIGCGIGRLMGPLSNMCGEIHGVDISDEMVRLGQERLAHISNSYLHWTAASDLRAFRDASFDFIYSFAVMQHLPDESLFWRYLSESSRVLRPQGILLWQFNSERTARERPDTWTGITLHEDRVLTQCAHLGLRVLALEGCGTQYTWLTALRVQKDEPAAPIENVQIQRVTGTSGEEHLTAGGPSGFAQVFVAHFPSGYCDLCGLSAQVGDLAAKVVRIADADSPALRQITVQVPEAAPVGEQRLSLTWRGVPIGRPHLVTVRRFLRGAPQVLQVTDGINLLDIGKVSCGVAKVWIRNLSAPTSLRVRIGAWTVQELSFYCEDTVDQRYQVNLSLPAALEPGVHTLEISAGPLCVFTGAIEHCPSGSTAAEA